MTKSSSQSAASTVRRAKVGRQMATLPAYLKCLVDPFSMPACQMPDLYGGKTTAFKLVEEFTVGSDAAGLVVFSIGTGLIRSYYINTVTAGVINGASLNQHPDYASIIASYAWARMVCFGVEVIYIGATQTAAGFLTVTEEHQVDYWSGANVSTIADDGLTDRAEKGRVIAVAPVHEPRFESDTGIAFGSPTFPNIFVSGQGLPTTVPSLFRVRITRHMEGLPLRSAALMRDAAKPSLSDPLVLAAASNIASVSSQSVNSPEARQSRTQAAVAAAWEGLERVGAAAVDKAKASAITVATDIAAGAFGAWIL